MTSLLALLACAGFGLDQYEADAGVAGALAELTPQESVQFPPTSAHSDYGGESEIVIYSAGDKPLAVHDIYIDGLDSENFELPDLPLPIMLEPGFEFPARIYFLPDAQGSYSADITVVTAGNLEEVTVSRRLMGDGCYDRELDGICDD